MSIDVASIVEYVVAASEDVPEHAVKKRADPARARTMLIGEYLCLLFMLVLL
jgi:hypothetical protein